MKKLKPKLPKIRAPKLKAPKLIVPKQLPFKRRRQADDKLVEALQNLPRITNETVAEHREEVLSGARKYIVPLSHSKRRIITITTSLVALAIVAFLIYCGLALYKFQSTSTFTYGVTQVLPFPVAKAGSSWVSYESYLFELRHTIHYYQSQQHEDFTTKSGKQHLHQLQHIALSQVVNDAYVKQLARQHHVGVSVAEVNDEVALVRAQNRLGSNDQVFRSVLNEFWGWTVGDFQRELRQQLLAQKLTAKLNTDTQARAQAALKQLQGGADFAAVATQVSDDTSTKANGGNYGAAIDQANRDIAPEVSNELFKLGAGHYSNIISTSYGLEIVKVIDTDGHKVHAAHIEFNFQPISTFVKPLEAKNPPKHFIVVS
jgi:hypothetical protein